MKSIVPGKLNENSFLVHSVPDAGGKIRRNSLGKAQVTPRTYSDHRQIVPQMNQLLRRAK